jgi:hypothetical protein
MDLCLCVCLFGLPKRRIQPERYAQLVDKNVYKKSSQKTLEKILKNE